MTLLSPFQALAEKWSKEGDHCNSAACSREEQWQASTLWDCSRELTELLGKVVVTDEMVNKAFYAAWEVAGEGKPWISRAIVRAALESALGVTK